MPRKQQTKTITFITDDHVFVLLSIEIAQPKLGYLKVLEPNCFESAEANWFP